MSKKSVELEVRVNAAQTMAELQKVGASFDTVAKKVKELNNTGTAVDTKSIAKQFGLSKAVVDKYVAPKNEESLGTIKGLKSMFGEESAFGNTMKMLRGGGAIAGFTMAADAAEQITAKMREMSAAVASGKANWADMTEQIVQSIPIMGQAYNATENIKAAVGSWFGHETSAALVTRLKEESAAKNFGTESTQGAMSRRKADARQWDLALVGARAKQVQFGLEGFDLSAAQTGAGLYEKTAQISSQTSADVEGLQEKKRQESLKAQQLVDAATTKGGREQAQFELEALNRRYDDEIALRKRRGQQMIALEQANTAGEWKAKYDVAVREANKYFDQLAVQEASIRAEGTRAMLGVEGRGFEAEMQQMYQQGEERKRVFKQQLEEQIKLIPPAMREAARQRGKEVLKDMEQSTNLQAIARYQQTLEAGTLGTYQKLAAAGDKMAAAEVQRLETAKALREEYNKLQTILNDPNSTPKLKEDAQRQLNGIAGREQAVVGGQLKNQRTGMLTALAGMGGVQGDQAKQELARQGMMDEFSASSADVAAILNNPNASPEQKRQALQMLMMQAGTAGARFGDQTRTALGAPMVGAESSYMMTGVSDRFASENDPLKQMAQLTKEQIKLQEEINDKLGTFLTQFGPLIQQLSSLMQGQ